MIKTAPQTKTLLEILLSDENKKIPKEDNLKVLAKDALNLISGGKKKDEEPFSVFNKWLKGI